MGFSPWDHERKVTAMTRAFATAASQDEWEAWYTLADLRNMHLNVHPSVTVGDYNNRFGTECRSWTEVTDDLEKNQQTRVHRLR